MATARTLLALAFALTLAGCGGPLVGVHLEETRICLVRQSQTVPGTHLPAGAVVADQAVTWEGDVDVGSVIPGLTTAGAVTGSIHVLSLTATAVPATTDLSGVSSAAVAVVDSAGQAATFLHYTRPQPVTTTSAIDMVLDQDLNMLDELQGGLLHYRVRFTGQPPSNDWTADIETCLSADLTVDALKALQ